MRVFVIHPGATFSTADVHTGLVWGLRTAGAEVIEYRLDKALLVSSALVHSAIAEDVLETPVDVFGLASAEAIAAAVHFEPDACLVVSGGNFPLSRALALKRLSAQRRVPFPVALFDTEAPYVTRAMQQMARHYDVIFTNERLAVDRYSHPHTYYLPHAFTPHVHQPGPAEADYDSDVLFIGTGFPERKELFAATDWGELRLTVLGALWETEVTDVAQTIAPTEAIENAEAVRYYRSAAINLNHHRTVRMFGSGEHIAAGEAESLGPRAYELAATGAFQLCDDSRPELAEVFGDAVPTYRAGDAEDLGRQVQRWAGDPEGRASLAAAALERVQPHRWDRRAEQVLTILEAARDDLKSRHRRKRRRVPMAAGTFVNLNKTTEASPHGDQAR